jgi:hypothetical protein
VAEREDETGAQTLADLLDHRGRLTAVRAFEIAVLEERQLGPEYAL